MVAVLRFISLLLTALLVGTMFGIWLGFDPAALTATAYVEMQQNTIRALNTPLPILGAVCIVLTLALAALTKDRPGRYLLIVAALCLIAAGLITRFANQPINEIVMAWSAPAPAANWAELRDTWWRWHELRTGAAVVALVLALLAAVRSSDPRSDR
ncbi:MAG: anthrone oxygenase family protein [Lautropia sp.]